jgi:hypothetical protein
MYDYVKPPPNWEFGGRLSLGASYEEGNTEKDTFNLDGQLELYKYPHRVIKGSNPLLTCSNEKDIKRHYVTTTSNRISRCMVPCHEPRQAC